jgi:hypothetical protein
MFACTVAFCNAAWPLPARVVLPSLHTHFTRLHRQASAAVDRRKHSFGWTLVFPALLRLPHSKSRGSKAGGPAWRRSPTMAVLPLQRQRVRLDRGRRAMSRTKAPPPKTPLCGARKASRACNTT